MEANPDLCMCMDFNHGCGGLYVRRPMGMVYYGVCVCVCVYKIDRVRLCECSSVWIKAIGDITLHDCYECVLRTLWLFWNSILINLVSRSSHREVRVNP